MKVYQAIVRALLILLILYGLYLFWAFLAFGGGCKKMRSETNILPYGYIGMVYVIFNQEDGLPKEYGRDGSRIYRIPKSGVLKTKFKGNYGWIDAGSQINVFYNKGDSLIKINKLLTEQELRRKNDSTQVVVFEYGYGGAKSNFGFEEDVLTFIVDSLKNFNKREYILTKEMFDNWNK